jgi:hypothetical protein
VPVATSYLYIALIKGVGDPWTLEIGALGGGFGGFGVLGEPRIVNEDIHMFGGGTCDSEP